MKERIISAVIMLAIIIPIIIIGGNIYIVAISLISLFAYKEIVSLKGLEKIPLLIKILGSIGMLSIVLNNIISTNNLAIEYPYLLVPIILIIVPMVFYKSNKYNSKEAFNLLSLIILVGLGFSGLLFIRNDLNILIYLILITTLGDSFAMFTGMLIGKHKLCPEISPKKTIEGSIGGLVVGTLVPLVYYNYVIDSITLEIVLITISLAVLEQIGDLIFSKIKRDNDTKDYSNLIPGHGGILDRLDSILIVSMTFMILSRFI